MGKKSKRFQQWNDYIKIADHISTNLSPLDSPEYISYSVGAANFAVAEAIYELKKELKKVRKELAALNNAATVEKITGIYKEQESA